MIMLKYSSLFFSTFLIVNFNIANAETVKIPEWVFDVYGFLIDEKISEEEFASMLIYLEKKDIVDLILHKTYDVKANFLLSITQKQNSEQFTSCSDDWYVTGYFIPVENDYSDKFITINIDKISREFRQDFVDNVKIEGWGKTLSGDYLGWYDNSFHISEMALDQNGHSLVVGKIAVDNSIINKDTKLIITTLPEPWNEIILLASDEGPSIKAKHIDLFTGEGKLAEYETFRITGYDNTVCQ